MDCSSQRQFVKASWTVILPTLNERENVPVLVRDILDLNIPELEILVVDDASTDKTVEALKNSFPDEKRLRILERHGKIPGLANSLNDGIENSTSDFLVWMDADRQMPASLIPELIRSFTPEVTAVVGSRFLSGGSDVRDSGRWSLISFHRILSWVLSRLVKVSLGLPFTDYTSGYVAIRRDFFEEYCLVGNHGEYFLYLLHSLHSNGKAVREIPYSLSKRMSGTSKTHGGSLSGLLRRGIPYLRAFIRLI
jgi:dolichol-phosphate mannosyltransferase